MWKLFLDRCRERTVKLLATAFVPRSQFPLPDRALQRGAGSADLGQLSLTPHLPSACLMNIHRTLAGCLAPRSPVSPCAHPGAQSRGSHFVSFLPCSTMTPAHSCRGPGAQSPPSVYKLHFKEKYLCPRVPHSQHPGRTYPLAAQNSSPTAILPAKPSRVPGSCAPPRALKDRWTWPPRRASGEGRRE